MVCPHKNHFKLVTRNVQQKMRVRFIEKREIEIVLHVKNELPFLILIIMQKFSLKKEKSKLIVFGSCRFYRTENIG